MFPVNKLTQTKSTISGCAGLGVSRISSYLFHLYKLVKIHNKKMLIISTIIYISLKLVTVSQKNTHDCLSQKYPKKKTSTGESSCWINFPIKMAMTNPRSDPPDGSAQDAERWPERHHKTSPHGFSCAKKTSRVNRISWAKCWRISFSNDMLWYVMICFDMLWYVMIWYLMICYDMLWYVMMSLLICCLKAQQKQ